MKEYMFLARRYEKLDPEDLAQELAIFNWKLRRKGENPRYIKKKLHWFSMDYRRKQYKEREKAISLDSEAELAANLMAPESFLMALGLDFRGVYPSPAGTIPQKEVFRLLSEGYTQREIANRLRISKSEAGRVVGKLRKSISGSV